MEVTEGVRFPGEVRKTKRCSNRGCGAKTTLGPFCDRHTREQGLILKPSRFGGLGLFAVSNRRIAGDRLPTFKRGEVIAEYGGRLRTASSEFRVEDEDLQEWTYAMDFGEKRFLDGRDSTSSLARFANDGTFEGSNNAEFSHYVEHPSKLVTDENGLVRVRTPDSVWLEALRDIYPEEEILASYGPNYWTERGVPTQIEENREKRQYEG